MRLLILQLLEATRQPGHLALEARVEGLYVLLVRLGKLTYLAAHRVVLLLDLGSERRRVGSAGGQE